MEKAMELSKILKQIYQELENRPDILVVANVLAVYFPLSPAFSLWRR